MRMKRKNGKHGEFLFLLDWKWFFILPTIIVQIDEPIFCYPTRRISFNWLGLHFSWLLIKERR